MSVLLLALFLETADLVARGGKVVTVDPSDRIAEAVAVAGNRIIAVGTEEAISVRDAIRMFTIWAAYGGFEEKINGSIEPGKLADLVVLSSDPLSAPKEALADIHADLVILDGKVAYERPSR